MNFKYKHTKKKRKPFQVPQLNLELLCILPSTCCWPNTQCSHLWHWCSPFPHTPMFFVMSLFVTLLVLAYGFCSMRIYSPPCCSGNLHDILSWHFSNSFLLFCFYLSPFNFQNLKMERDSRK